MALTRSVLRSSSLLRSSAMMAAPVYESGI
jgi:hypothetical protein